MTATKDKPGARGGEQTGPGTSKRFTPNCTPSKSAAVQLHRVLNLVADSAIDADDAITRNDPEALSRAIAALGHNAAIAQSLALAWRAA
jgi:hypothetical protein